MNKTTESHLQTKRVSLIVKRDRLLDGFADATKKARPAKMERICRDLRQTNEFLDLLTRIENEKPALASGYRYVVSSMFLHECFKDLTADRDEQFFFITGSEVEGKFVLDQKAEFEHTKRSMIGVTGNMSATHRLLIRLEQFGHRLLAHFHSHPGNGADATHPSGIDERFQKRLEDAGYPTVAAIFSRDGYVRFLRLDENLKIEIHGTGVEDLGKNIYRLTNLD
jgi:hypothetical protein